MTNKHKRHAGLPAPVASKPVRFNRLPLACLISSSLLVLSAPRELAAEELLSFTRAAPVTANAAPADVPVARTQPPKPATTVTRTTRSVASNVPARPAGQSGLLQFKPATSVPPATAASTAAPKANVAATGNPPAVRTFAPAPLPAKDSRELPVEPVSSVSALSLAGVPPKLAARQGQVAGPSEMELRNMFFRAVKAAADRSPQVQRAHAEQEAAVADIDQAKGQRWPQLEIGATSKAAEYGGETESNADAGVNLNLRTSVYDWGRISNTIEAREHLSSAAESTVAAERENSAFEVVSSMIELGKQRLIADLSQDFVDRMDELVKMLAGIVAVDKGRTSELTQAKARLLQAQAARDNAASKATDAEINLRKLVGPRPVMIPNTSEWNIRLANLDALLLKVDDHPTIHKALSDAQAADAQVKVIRASSLPALNWVVSKTTADDSLGREQPWTTSLAVTWSAFDGGSSRAGQRAALQRAEAGRQVAEQQRLDLEYRVRTANHDAKTLLERAELYRDLSVESARIRVAFYEQWYHLGKRTLLDVLTAENDHYGNQVSEVSSRFDGYQAIFRQYAGAGTLVSWLSAAQH
ncbi:TolC family protein [Pseudomonas fluorescens]|uniref:TolC family protein n=1 Tax=Pseudomonas fluorescens TaxID=294 RepID=UPI001A9E5A94|nr:TolC family protein [Pseudomonas fluorescens]QTD31466.1 TolC family protein [Pseudomonas fluorescens]